MAFDPVPPPTPGEIVRASFGQTVAADLDDHEARLLDLEATIGSPGGTPGDVVGPASATDHAIARYDGTTGALLQNSGITIPDGASGSVNGTNTGDVTLAGLGDYLTLAAQVLTRALIDLTAHVTGRLPWANVAQVAANRLLGRTGSTGDVQEVAIGSGLALDSSGLRVTAAGGGVPALDDLTDVAVTAPATDDVLRYDGAAWVNGPAPAVPPPAPAGATQTTWLVSGGQVVWESAYTFRVSAADYYIAGTHYTSAEATATLGAADATLDRIDVIALNTASAVVVLPGTAAATPSEPSVDPAAYLKLAIVSVPHATSAPPDVETVSVYAEHAGAPSEWAWTSSGASIVVNSTNAPHVGTTSIEGTNVVTGVYAQGTSASPIDPTNYDHLLLFIRSKAAWNSSRGLLVTLRLAGVLVGAAVQLRRSGTFGFDSTLTGSYQMVAIPVAAFAVPQGTPVDQVRLEDFGGAIGFFVDDVSFQAAGSTAVGGGGLTQDQADARYAPLVHAPRHANGGSDAVNVTALAGFPGGTTSFLRADATFAAVGGGPPTAHATTHDTAGSDPITALAASVITTGTIASARLPARMGAIGLIIDGGGSAITTGVKGDLYLPFACTITASTLIADVSGSVVLDLLLSASYATTPTVSIVASAPPTLASAASAQDTTLTGWTVSVAAGSRLRYSVTSAATITRLTHTLTVSAP